MTDSLNTSMSQGQFPDEPYAYVDGSCIKGTGFYGYGVRLYVNGKRYILEGKGKSSMDNIAGEVEAPMVAVRKAEELGVSKLTLLYDYTGIEGWATGWQAYEDGSIAYRDFMKPRYLAGSVDFQKVDKNLNLADVIAKHASFCAAGKTLEPKFQKKYDRAIADANELWIDGVLISYKA